MQKKPEDKAKPARQAVQLQRLARLVDVVYALVIWRAFVLIPRPETTDWNWETFQTFVSAEAGNVVVILLMVVIAVIYWLQSATLLGNLRATDGWHTTLSVLQVFFLLVFLYTIRLHIELGDSVGTRILESSMAGLMGVTAAWSWAYAMKGGRLLRPEVDPLYSQKLRDRTWAEPITALITIPCAFVGPLAWELAWFSYPVVRSIAKKIKRA